LVDTDISFLPATVIAEVGAVHLGQMDRACELIRLAKLAGADYVKFQKRNPKESVRKDIQTQPHPNPYFAYGPTYLEHREALELSKKQHKELCEHCAEAGIGYSVSVWDKTSAEEMVDLNPSYIKVPSACNLFFGMMDILFNEYKGDIHISLGMTMAEEVDRIREYIGDRMDRCVIYHCTSAYPCPFEFLYLNEIEHLKDEFASEGARIGFSNHGYGIAADIAAYVFGARYIERHFVDDRTVRHTDSSASLEPDGLRRLCRDLKAVSSSMRYKPMALNAMESEQREKLKWQI